MYWAALLITGFDRAHNAEYPEEYMTGTSPSPLLVGRPKQVFERVGALAIRGELAPSVPEILNRQIPACVIKPIERVRPRHRGGNY